MKFFTLVAAAPAVLALPKIVRDTDNPCDACPTDTTDACYIPDTDPHFYTECSNGEPINQKCSPGLIWNNDLQVCDWPTGICDECSGDTSSSCYFPDADPHYYTECSNGEPISQECSPGLVWNNDLQVCDWPSTIGQDEIIIVINPCDECPVDTTEACYFPDEDPHFYTECSNGEPITQKCSPGLVWNNDLQVCDWPSDVGQDEIIIVINPCDECPADSEEACYFADENPTKYTECSNGEPIQQECAAGLIWNQSCLQCLPANFDTTYC